MEDQKKILSEVTDSDYKYGFQTDIDTETIPKGLSEDVVRIISSKKQEPEWLLESRLKAFRHWQTLEMPQWAHLMIPKINYQDIIFYAAPKREAKYENLDEVDPELIDTFNKLGIPLEEQKMLTGVVPPFPPKVVLIFKRQVSWLMAVTISPSHATTQWYLRRMYHLQ